VTTKEDKAMIDNLVLSYMNNPGFDFVALVEELKGAKDRDIIDQLLGWIVGLPDRKVGVSAGVE
jgi:hypothetical protein